MRSHEQYHTSRTHTSQSFKSLGFGVDMKTGSKAYLRMNVGRKLESYQVEPIIKIPGWPVDQLWKIIRCRRNWRWNTRFAVEFIWDGHQHPRRKGMGCVLGQG